MKSLINAFDRFLQKVVPDPFVIAIGLTALTFVACSWLDTSGSSGSAGPASVIRYWGDGFWELASFTLQMAMILIGGYVVAVSRPVAKVLRFLIGFVRTPTAAVLFCTLAAIAASWINWGFGLVVGAIVAVEVGKQVPAAPFRLLVASSYSGFIVWHGGLSGSIPLELSSLTKVSGDLLSDPVPLAETMFSRLNLIALVSIAVLLPVTNLLMLRGTDTSSSEANGSLLTGKSNGNLVPEQPTIWINRSVAMMLVLVGMAAYYFVDAISAGSFALNLNSVIFIFFIVGFLLHGSPDAFIRAFTEATPKVAPILIQYPLYAGIMAMLAKSGMASQISQWFVDHSTAETFPLMTFFSAGLLNLLVPSGGGQWGVQARIVVEAAQSLGVDLPRVAMAVAWGDAWTNLAQPFWAVPVLTIAGLSIKDILGFCLLNLLLTGVVLSLIFLIV